MLASLGCSYVSTCTMTRHVKMPVPCFVSKYIFFLLFGTGGVVFDFRGDVLF